MFLKLRFKKLLSLLPFLLLLPFLAKSQSAQPGDIVITEFMADPDATSDSDGEYVELYNRRSYSINIDGFTLSDDGSNSHLIDNGGTLTIPAGGFIVLATSASPGFTPDYVYSSFTLSNTDDEIVLQDSEGKEIARLNYNSTGTGESSELNDIQNVDANGEASASNYIAATSQLGNGDYGTPGNKGQTSLAENPTVRILQSNFSVAENSGTGAITVIIEDPDGSAVDVDLVFDEENSQAEPEDFTSSSPVTISFPASATDGDTQTAYPPNNDSSFEGDEEAIFTLSNVNTSGNAAIANATSATLTIVDDDQPNVVINEINADPGGDADGNGTPSVDSDEFVEIFNNNSVDVDISGWTLSDAGGVLHTFSVNTILKANEAVVVFDDSAVPTDSFGGSLVLVSDSDLSLNNSDETLTLSDGASNSVDSYSYSTAASGQSMVRNPDGTGSFDDHTSADTDDSSISSPGTKIDGSNFNNTLTISGDAGWRMLSAPVDDMQISDLDDDIHIQGVGNSGEDNIFVSYDGTNFVQPTSLSDNLSSGNGFIVYLFNNDDYSSSNLPVTVDPGSTSEPQSDVTVNLHSSGDKWNLIGNPFSTALSVTDIANWTDGSTTLNSNVGQIWDDETQSYVLTSNNNEKVAHWQGFFIENNDANTLTIPTSAKTSGTNFYKESGQKGLLAFKLKGQHPKEDLQTTDKATVLYFHEQATHEKDIYDATKLAPMTSRYAILGFSSADQDATGSGLNLRAQDSRPFDFEGDLSIDMELQTYQMEGSFTLSWESIELPEAWTFTLIDNETGAEINMNTEENYTFSYTPQQPEKNGLNEESNLNRSLPKAVAVKSREQGQSRFTIKASAPGENSSTSSEIPESVKLNPNYPNPFNPNTTITFELTEQAHVELNVYTIVGQKVATLVDGVREMGEHQESWNAADMPSGIYIAQLEVQGRVYIRKMTLIK